MPRLLMEYGTTDGQTARICYFLTSELMRLGVQVDLEEAGTGTADPADYDGILVAGSIHAGGYQKALVRWARTHALVLGTKPTVFLSVCLGILEDNPKTRAELDRILDEFARRTNWRADQIKEVAGALKYTKYGWLKKRIMRYIAGKAGGSTDMSRDHEYTDWADLRAFADLLAGWLPMSPAGVIPRPYARSHRTVTGREAPRTANAP